MPTDSILPLYHQQSSHPLSDKSTIPVFPKDVHDAVPMNSPPASLSDTEKGDICRWKDEGTTASCRKRVTNSNLVEHLASHGIKNMASHVEVSCGVCGKVVKRESMLRHYRELHLKQKRKPSMKQEKKLCRRMTEGATPRRAVL